MKRILPLILLYLLQGQGFASTFGKSCVPLFSNPDDYLINKTAYGFIQRNIDMQTYIQDGCTASEDFKFCVRDKDDKCPIIEKNIGDKFLISTLQSNVITDTGLDAQLSIEYVEKTICLTVPTSRGSMPIMCKHATEEAENQVEVINQCSVIADSCYNENTKSQSLLNFSGLTIDCLSNTLDKIFYTGSDCALEEDITTTALLPFPKFVKQMKVAVVAGLILYVMIFGFKLAMNHEYANLNKVATLIIKIIFVVYFSIGFTSDNERFSNGVTEVGLPLLSNATSTFAEMVFNAGGSRNLCEFDVEKYPNNYEFYKLWDAIDCRIGYYLGMKALYNIGDAFNNVAEDVSEDTPETLGNSTALTFFTVMFGFFMSGQIILVFLGIVFAIMITSIIFYFFTAYLVSLVTLYVMAYISPIFVPMILFQRTKSYFDSWLRIVFSCVLQPTVIAGFIALALTMYDSAIYGNCEFKRHDYNSGTSNFSTFELTLPAVDIEKCESSVGYKLSQYYLGHGWESRSAILFKIFRITDYLDLLSSLTYVIIFCFIFYYAMQSVSEFASDLTGGPSTASATISPNALIDKAMNTAKAGANLISAAIKAKTGDVQGAASDVKKAKSESGKTSPRKKIK